jgi:hypothetical protein
MPSCVGVTSPARVRPWGLRGTSISPAALSAGWCAGPLIVAGVVSPSTTAAAGRALAVGAMLRGIPVPRGIAMSTCGYRFADAMRHRPHVGGLWRGPPSRPQRGRRAAHPPRATLSVGLLELLALAPRHLLQLEGVAVRIGEACTPDAAPEVVDLADLHASTHELGTRLVESSTTRCTPLTLPGSPAYTSKPVPKPTEQAEPSGVSWTTRTPSPGCTSRSFVKPSWSA